jgi:hypothetical protein
VVSLSNILRKKRPMRNVVLYHLLSVDGVADAPDRYVDNFDDVIYENLRRVIDAQDAVLLVVCLANN